MLRPFVNPLIIPANAVPAATLSNLNGRYLEYGTPTCYVLEEQESWHTFHRDLPPTKMWTYNGTFPGPVITNRLRIPTVVRRINNLNPNYRGFGIVETALHHHGGFQDPQDDGWPMDFIHPGEFKDYLIPNQVQRNDRSHWACSTWYHDHVADHTSGNVYHGLAGVTKQFDSLDSGDERDPSPTALRLPSGAYDIPLAFTDYILNKDGSLYFDQFNDNGQVGDLFVVNGKVQPFLNVARRKYRFRLLCASQARHYNIRLSNGAPFQIISGDGGLLSAPVTTTSIYLVPGERYDIVADFSTYMLGTQIALINDLDQTDGNKPNVGKINIQPLLLFVVNFDADDSSRVPSVLQTIPTPDLSQIVATRNIEFHRSNGAWLINKRFWDPEVPLFQSRLGTSERWRIINGSGGWHHPFHIHVENFQILSRNGKSVPHHQRGRKDVLNIPGGEYADIYIHFYKYAGKYALHCHNLGHEDLAMMGWVNVQP